MLKIVNKVKLLIMNYYFAYQIPKSVQNTAISDRADIQRALNSCETVFYISLTVS
jgi:hypothetical protein